MLINYNLINKIKKYIIYLYILSLFIIQIFYKYNKFYLFNFTFVIAFFIDIF